MNKTLLKLSKLPYFRISHLEAAFPNLKKTSIYQKISRWIKTKDIIKLKNGYFTAYADNHTLDLNYFYYLANILRYPSYASGVFVLQNYGVLTDITYPITSITTKSTRKYSNKLGIFVYNSISPKLYIGYERLLYHDEPIYVATLAKALFDYLYIKYLKIKIIPEEIIARERLNLEKFNKKDVSEFKKYCKISKNKTLINFASILWKI